MKINQTKDAIQTELKLYLIKTPTHVEHYENVHYRTLT